MTNELRPKFFFTRSNILFYGVCFIDENGKIIMIGSHIGEWPLESNEEKIKKEVTKDIIAYKKKNPKYKIGYTEDLNLPIFLLKRIKEVLEWREQLK